MAEPSAATYPTSAPTLFSDIKNAYARTVSGAYTDSDTTITCSAAITPLVAPNYLLNGTTGEIIYFEGVSGSDLTSVTRGADGSTAAAMADGEILYLVHVANHRNQTNRELTAVAATIGTAPLTIDDTVDPTSSPSTIAVWMDMMSNIVKTITGAATWDVADSYISPVAGIYTGTADGRLTLETGVPISTSDQSAKTTLYYTPHIGNQIVLYDGSADWELIEFSEISISLAGLTASKPYDVFVYNNGGTATLELLAWTDATNRATALVLQDGVWVKSGATTRRLVGTVYINSTGGQTDDTNQKRFIINANNAVERPLTFVDATASWAVTGVIPFRQMRSTVTNKVEFIVALPEQIVWARQKIQELYAANNTFVSIGLDSITAQATDAEIHNLSMGGLTDAFDVQYRGLPGIGYHYLAPLERTDNGATTTMYGGIYHMFSGGILG
jgi:hypothetical protein